MTRSHLGFAGLVLALSASPASAQFGPASVVTAPVVRKTIAAGQTFVATVRPTRVSTVGSAVDGRVLEFPVNEGDRVTQGQALAQLRTGTLELERDAARNELEMYRHELAELENGSRPEEISAAKARLKAAEANRRYAKSKLDRTQALFSQRRSATEEELQSALAEADQSEQKAMEAQEMLRMAEIGPRPEKIAQARSRVHSQSDVVSRLEDQLKLHTIRAPFNGYITMEYCEVGQWLLKGDKVVEVIELDQVDLEVNVTEQAVVHLQVGDTALVEVTALPDMRFTGKVALIVPQANPRSRTFPVKVRVDNSIRNDLPLLKSNMFARVTLGVGKPESGLLVPKDAVVLGGVTPLVYVVAPDPMDSSKTVARPVPVRLGVCDGEMIQVIGELAEGQAVVVKGNERLRPGQAIVAR